LKKKRLLEFDIEQWVIENLWKVEKGLKFVAKQVDLGEFGRLDVLARDSNGHYVILELKGPEEMADETIVSQVFKYRTGLKMKKEYRIGNPTEVRILCFVNEIAPKARKICEHAGVHHSTWFASAIV